MTSASLTIAGVRVRSRPVRAGDFRHEACLLCDKSFIAGETYSMIPTGPLDAIEARKAKAGQPFIAVHKPAHELCYWVRLSKMVGFMRHRAIA